MYELKELKEKRAALVHQQKDLFERAKKEGRNLTTDENDQFERMEAEFSEMSRSITNHEKMVDILGKQASQQEQRQDEQTAPEYRQTFSKYLRRGTGGLNQLEQNLLLQHRGTDPQSTTTTAGGYTIPEGFSNELFVEMALWGGMLQAARVVRTASGNAIPWPTVDDTAETGAILAEADAAAVADMSFGVKTLNAYTYTSKMVKVTMELMQDTAFNLEGFLQSAFARRLGTIMNAHFTTGTGTGQPSGVVTAATSFTTGVAAAAITRDNLVDLIHSVNPAYRQNAVLMFNDTTLSALKKLAFGSGDDRPLWQASIREGEPDRLEGFRYVINQDMANIGASAKSVLFGDFSQYIIRLAGPATTLRLNERYAEFLHTGFLAYQRADGELLTANAIKSLTHAAS